MQMTAETERVVYRRWKASDFVVKWIGVRTDGRTDEGSGESN